MSVKITSPCAVNCNESANTDIFVIFAASLEKGHNILAHRIRIPEILPRGRKSYLTHVFVIFAATLENGNNILAHRIRISVILPWDRKYYLTHAILPRTSLLHVC